MDSDRDRGHGDTGAGNASRGRRPRPWPPGRARARAAARLAAAGALLAAAVGVPRPAAAQEEERETGWSYGAELTFVLTGGNAESSTLGLGASARHLWERSELFLEGGGIRTESSMITRLARGTPEDFEVVEESDSELTAENYFLRARFDRTLSQRIFAFGSAGWERNTFAGFDGRYSLAAGTGVAWLDREAHRFKTDIGLTYTVQDDVLEDPTSSDEFAGLRFSWEYLKALSETARFTSTLVADENLNETDDLRADLTNAISLALSEVLSFRTSLQLLFDARPSLTTVPLVAPDGTPTGETVRAELDELDTRIRFALVASF